MIAWWKAEPGTTLLQQNFVRSALAQIGINTNTTSPYASAALGTVETASQAKIVAPGIATSTLTLNPRIPLASFQPTSSPSITSSGPDPHAPVTSPTRWSLRNALVGGPDFASPLRSRPSIEIARRRGGGLSPKLGVGKGKAAAKETKDILIRIEKKRPATPYRQRRPTIPDIGIDSGSPTLSYDKSRGKPNISIVGSDGPPMNPADEWGPQHPCFPHLNNHVPLASSLYQTTRIIRIRRDWMVEGDLAPTFSNLYPEILEPAGVSEQEFRALVERVNTELIAAFSPYSIRNIVDGVLGLLTGWLWDDTGLTAVKSRLKKVELYLEEWNREMEGRSKEEPEHRPATGLSRNSE
ncbi:putative Ras modification protein erf4 [Diplocarpon rosae]|nr:putative Ras modification protein erf4 [Diplocarpon rosae]